LYAGNIEALLGLMIDEGQPKLDLEDEGIVGACVTRGGEIRHEGAKAALQVNALPGEGVSVL
jgi:H+-translocating NAD(P) transhydrogenase subunit alpha